jgi:2-dehydropantoate 2-reductase
MDRIKKTPFLKQMIRSSILIIGSGAMACLFAARLSAAGMDVCLVDEWENGINEINRNGITLLSPAENFHCQPRAFHKDEAVPSCDAALVLVKSWQTAWAAEVLKKALPPSAAVLTLQNGLGNDTLLAEGLGRERVVAGVTTLGATLVSAGVVHGFEEGLITLQNHPAASEILKRLQPAGLKVQINANIDQVIWGKLVINAVINPLTALLEIDNGQLLNLPSLTPVIQLLLDESTRVASSLFITLPYADPFKQIQNVAALTASNHSSMYQDIKRGAPTEIDYINGAIVRLGLEHNIPTPSHSWIVSLIKAKIENKMMEVNQ